MVIWVMGISGNEKFQGGNRLANALAGIEQQVNQDLMDTEVLSDAPWFLRISKP